MSVSRTPGLIVRLIAIVGIAASCAGLAACTRESSGSPPQGATPPLASVGPLEDALGFDPLTPVEFNAEYQKHLVDVEEVVAQCMAAQGFQYTPWPVAQHPIDLAVSTGTDPGEWGSLAYREQWGYGISTDPPDDELDTSQPDNPNDAVVDAMTDAERDAWRTANEGESQGYTRPVDLDDGGQMFMYRWQDNGCVGQARHEVLASLPGYYMFDERFQSLLAEISEMRLAFQTSTERRSILEDWAICMKGAGFDGLSSTPDAYSYVSDIALDPAAAGMTLSQVQSVEIDVAVADYTCAVDNNIEPRVRELDYQLQQEFLDAHREQIEVLLAEVRATPSAAASSGDGAKPSETS